MSAKRRPTKDAAAADDGADEAARAERARLLHGQIDELVEQIKEGTAPPDPRRPAAPATKRPTPRSGPRPTDPDAPTNP